VPKNSSTQGSKERMRAYRARLAAQGFTEYTIKLKKACVRKIERIAKAKKISVTAAIEQLIEHANE
jgi:hypothetical protein